MRDIETINKSRQLTYVAKGFTTGLSDLIVAVRAPDGGLAGTSGEIAAVTFTEQGNGVYVATYTPNQLGVWEEFISSSSNGDHVVMGYQAVAFDTTDVANSVADVKSELDTVSSNVDTINTNVSSIETTVGTIDTNVSSIETTVGDTKTELDSVQSTVNDIQTTVNNLNTEASGGYVL